MQPLGYKEYLISLKYAALKYLDYHSQEEMIDVYYDEDTKEIISIVKMPYSFKVKQIKVSLAQFIIYVTTITNPYLDINLIQLRFYRYFYKKTKKEFSFIIGCSEDDYAKYERGILHSINIDQELFKKLNIPEFKVNFMEGL